MADTERLHIDELASLGGVSRRTVRFYVQRGLLPGPEGAGRGAGYTPAHLERLVRIRDLQAAGVPLTAIAEVLEGGTVPSAPRRPRAVHALVFELAPGVLLQVQSGALPDAVAAEVAGRVQAMLVAAVEANASTITDPPPNTTLE